MFCTKCGKQIPSNYGFCPNCGSVSSRQLLSPEQHGSIAEERKPSQKKSIKYFIFGLCNGLFFSILAILILYKHFLPAGSATDDIADLVKFSRYFCDSSNALHTYNNDISAPEEFYDRIYVTEDKPEDEQDILANMKIRSYKDLNIRRSKMEYCKPVEIAIVGCDDVYKGFIHDINNIRNRKMPLSLQNARNVGSSLKVDECATVKMLEQVEKDFDAQETYDSPVTYGNPYKIMIYHAARFSGEWKFVREIAKE